MRRPVPSAILAVSCLAAAAVGVALAAVHVYAGGRWIAPLDDAYIALGYARQWARGEPFTFRPGGAIATGATSLLHVWLLAPLAALAETAERPLLAGLLALNAALWIGLVLLARRLARALGIGWLAWPAALAAGLNPHVLYGLASGMDTILAAAALLFAWDRWTAATSDRAGRWWAIPAAASVGAALARPELGPASIAIAIASVAWPAWRQGARRRATAALAASAGPCLAAAFVPALVTGSILPSSGWAKIGWGAPHGSTAAALQASADFVVDALKGVWMGAYPGTAAVGAAGSALAENEAIFAFPPGALLAALVGAFALPQAARGCAAAGAAGWAAGWLLVAAVLPAGWHHHRYLAPFFPPFTLLAFAGLARIADVFPEPSRRPLAAGLAAAWLFFLVPGSIRAFAWIGRGAETHAAQHRALTEYLDALKRPGSVAAVDVGVLGYFGRREVRDLKGLTEPDLAAAGRAGWGALHDRLQTEPAGRRPAFAALHPGRPDVNAELAERAGLIRPVASFPHPRGAPPLVLYEFHWPDRGGDPSLPGWRTVDSVDPGDPASEAAHGYTVRTRSLEGIPYSSLQIRMDSALGGRIGDGGWVTDGGESFALAARPGDPLVLLIRTYAPRGSALDVTINGAVLPRVRILPDREQFQTILLARVPAGGVQERNEIRIRCAVPDAGEYAAYRYWGMQPVEP